ncbi:MAG: acetyl-CoA carboxylase biotin carboxylase subunit [Bacteroidetes bacterium]|nr:acetyl-CoA carboxylase biotin carboxylase subunit [Bacteroidota bacterium]MCY4234073.1 acetyl-CoA carboxylase biotin carboxylase subunit [Bacteroidota bacterium]
MNKILIANRGEIALRVIRACKELGIQTVAVYSTADSNALHVRYADEAVCIGPALSSESYLKPDRIMAAAEITGADAIHPGYGFLSENAVFSAICGDNGIKFIGPAPKTIAMMGDKSQAKDQMRAAGVPVIPGSDGIVESIEDGQRIAESIGFPVMIKASAGGGGKGMRAVMEAKDFELQFQSAQAEAESSFGNSDIYIEKLIQKPRHIEIQVMGDGQGTTLHYGERECSIQRRHQKLLEEAPSLAVNEDLRQRMGSAAISGASAVNYEGAGTIEFLLDSSGEFYFMEMNTRIQVEHPVTEEITGLDLIRQQILIAMGERLTKSDIPINGHSIECRINAEDPSKNFLPSPGIIKNFHPPNGPGIRTDTHVYAGYTIPPHYDSMIAKLIVHAPNREWAILRMQRALDEFVLEGIATTIPFHQELLQHPAFISGEIETHFVENTMLPQQVSN